MDTEYRTIVADPPWVYKAQDAFSSGSWGFDVSIGDRTYRRKSRVSANERYSTLSLEQLCTLPVARFASDDAYLWLWIPNEHLLNGVHQTLCRSWGFTVRGSMVWVKKGTIGIGYWLRYNHEHIVLATRGKPGPLRDRGLPSTLITKRTPHSAKPEAFFRLVESACPGPYLSLFERHRRGEQGDLLVDRSEWTVWGDEVGDTLGIGFDPTEWSSG